MTHHDWLKIMVRGARCLDAVPFGLTIVDPRTGEIAHHNQAMATLLGQPVPATVAELDALGVVPARVRQEFVAVGLSLDDEDRYAVVDTTVQHPDGSVRELTVHLAHFHAFRGEGSVLAITVMGFDNTFDYEDLEWSLNPPGEIHVVYDLDLVAVAADQRHVEYGIDPAAQIGTQGFLVSHPEDAVAVSPKVRAVVTGEALDAQYTVRVIGPAAAWTTVSVTISRFVGAEDLLLVTNTPRDVAQVPLDHEDLDDRERAIAWALLTGRRPAQIASEQGISVHTVRHWMTTLFRKLGVDGQVELQRRYHVPHVPHEPLPTP